MKYKLDDNSVIRDLDKELFAFRDKTLSAFDIEYISRFISELLEYKNLDNIKNYISQYPKATGKQIFDKFGNLNEIRKGKKWVTGGVSHGQKGVRISPGTSRGDATRFRRGLRKMVKR